MAEVGEFDGSIGYGLRVIQGLRAAITSLHRLLGGDYLVASNEVDNASSVEGASANQVREVNRILRELEVKSIELELFLAFLTGSCQELRLGTVGLLNFEQTDGSNRDLLEEYARKLQWLRDTRSAATFAVDYLESNQLRRSYCYRYLHNNDPGTSLEVDDEKLSTTTPIGQRSTGQEANASLPSEVLTEHSSDMSQAATCCGIRSLPSFQHAGILPLGTTELSSYAEGVENCVHKGQTDWCGTMPHVKYDTKSSSDSSSPSLLSANSPSVSGKSQTPDGNDVSPSQSISKTKMSPVPPSANVATSSPLKSAKAPIKTQKETRNKPTSLNATSEWSSVPDIELCIPMSSTRRSAHISSKEFEAVVRSLRELHPEMLFDVYTKDSFDSTNSNTTLYRTLFVTLSRVLRVAVFFAGLNIQTAIVRAYTESLVRDSDGKVDWGGVSKFDVFQRLTEQADVAILNYELPDTSISSALKTIKKFMNWLSSYKDLFSAPCVFCGCHLQMCRPPVGRDLIKFQPYHIGVCHAPGW